MLHGRPRPAAPGRSGQGHVLFRPLGEWELGRCQGEGVLRVWLVGPDGAKMPSNPSHEARCVMRTLHRPLPDVRPHGGSEKPAEFPKTTRLAGGRARCRPRKQGMERTRALQPDPEFRFLLCHLVQVTSDQSLTWTSVCPAETRRRQHQRVTGSKWPCSVYHVRHSTSQSHLCHAE